jgi:hypothetical protein
MVTGDVVNAGLGEALAPLTFGPDVSLFGGGSVAVGGMTMTVGVGGAVVKEGVGNAGDVGASAN